jgi:hypothetical protein
VLAYTLSRFDHHVAFAPEVGSSVRRIAHTLAGVGPARPIHADDLGSEGPRTVGASSLECATSVPDIAVSERPGERPLTAELRLLDAYIRQVKRCDVPLMLAVGKTRRQ